MQQVDKWHSQRGEVDFSRRPLSYQFFVMQKLHWSFSPPAGSFLSSQVPGTLTINICTWSAHILHLSLFFVINFSPFDQNGIIFIKFYVHFYNGLTIDHSKYFLKFLSKPRDQRSLILFYIRFYEINFYQ